MQSLPNLPPTMTSCNFINYSPSNSQHDQPLIQFLIQIADSHDIERSFFLLEYIHNLYGTWTTVIIVSLECCVGEFGVGNVMGVT